MGENAYQAMKERDKRIKNYKKQWDEMILKLDLALDGVAAATNIKTTREDDKECLDRIGSTAITFLNACQEQLNSLMRDISAEIQQAKDYYKK